MDKQWHCRGWTGLSAMNSSKYELLSFARDPLAAYGWQRLFSKEGWMSSLLRPWWARYIPPPPLEIKLFMSRRVQAEDSWISDTRCWGNCSIPLVDRLQENEGGGRLSLQVFLRMERTIWTLDTAQAHRRTSGRPTAPHLPRLQRRQPAVSQRWEGWTFW